MKHKKARQFLKRMASLALVGTLLVESVQAAGMAVHGAPPDAISEGTQEVLLEEMPEEGTEDAKELEILFEMEENREQDSKHYRLSDGSIMAAGYGMDVHYEKDGHWEDIDNRFVYEPASEEDPMEGFATAQSGDEFRFAPDTSGSSVARISGDGYEASFGFLGVPQDGAAGNARNRSQGEESPSGIGTVPLTFIKGAVLNMEEAEESFAGEDASVCLLALEEDGSVSGSAQQVHENAEVSLQAPLYAAVFSSEEAGAPDTDDTGTVWAMDWDPGDNGTEEGSLVRQAALERTVTSVGYEEVLPGVSLQYVARGSSLKEYILVSRPQERYEYLFSLDLTGLLPKPQADGSILLLDKDSQEAVYEIPAAYMSDAAGECSGAVDMELKELASGEYLLKVTADAAWIGDEKRVFPVRIDPTLNKKLTSSADVRGSYVREGEPGQPSVNYGELYVGYDSSGNRRMKSYIQMRNLPQLPKDSVICSSVFNLAVLGYSQVAWPKLHIRAREVKNTDWSSSYTWNSQPQAESLITDQRTITSSDVGKYVGWNITSLVKAHYEAGNQSGAILAFELEAYGSMTGSKCANTPLNLLWSGGEPVFQIFYRDTRGVEDYYTYQVQDLGHAGTGYIGDYTSQLTVSKTISSYDSTVMPFDIGIVYNSAYSGGYFTAGGDIHTKDFSKMPVGTGWKLTLQETVVPVSITDSSGTATYLVYNDADGTEHYFRKSESDSSKYEDEDGLNLTITKSGTTYTMKDKKDNVKTFADGYLTGIADANGNRIVIHYNDRHQITSVGSLPKGGTEKTIFTLSYYPEGVDCLDEIQDHAGRRYRFSYTTDKNGRYQLYQILHYHSNTDILTARYLYGADHLKMTHAYDAESGTGVQYTYMEGTTGYRIYEYWEYAAADAGSTQTAGAKARTWTLQMRQARYRFSGADGQIDTDDDVITNYLFNSAGQTINARSELEKTGQLLGVSASAYTKNSGTSKKNNRLSSSISSGQAGVNLLENGGFERDTDADGIPDGWGSYLNGCTAEYADSMNSSTSGASRSGRKHYRITSGGTTGTGNLYQDISVEAGKTYTFSAYVNTSGITAAAGDGGVYLYARAADGNMAAKSIRIAEASHADVEGGWRRLSTTFTADTAQQMRLVICCVRARGTILVDEVQMEAGDAASRFSHVYNGSFESSRGGWSVSHPAQIATDGQTAAQHGALSLKISAEVPETVYHASQSIPLYRSSGTTFLLSGWSRGNSVPDLEQEFAGKNDASLRCWGIALTLNYTDGSAPEYFTLPFSDYATNWQYAAMAVTPKAQDKTISTAVLGIYYQNNANAAYFDNISLIEEPAQTYRYDKDGNLESVKSSGNGQDDLSYDETTQNLMSVATEGSGDYTYEYNNTDNKHLPTAVINDSTTMDISYDSLGQTVQTSLRNNRGETALTMTSTASYADGLLTAVTDNTGAGTSYSYDGARRVFLTEDAKGTQIHTGYDDAWNRPVLTYQQGRISVSNTYTKGNLSRIRRSGYVIPGNTSTQRSQDHDFTYDAFGNNTGVSIGTFKLVQHQYKSRNGSLERTVWGDPAAPLASVDYSYDALDRVREAVYHDSASGDSVRYGYHYSADGSLAGISEDGELLYTYEYDSLGRLIHSGILEDGSQVLYTDHKYDTSDRILSQSWQIGEDGFTESYTYNENDGTLSAMRTGGDDVSFVYDGLKRLSQRTSPVMKVSYSYRNTDSTRTTTQVEGISYLDSQGNSRIPALGYSYDAVGNITQVTSGGTAAAQYTYDVQNQLASEKVYGYRGGTLQSSYSYDTYGNIRSILTILPGYDSESYAFTYGNAQWADLLTRVSYTDETGRTSSGDLTYDSIGNPLTYFNGHKSWNFTWKYGKELASATSGSTTVTYEYDADGIRQKKQAGTKVHTYTTLDGKVVREDISTGAQVDYFYDNEGKPYKISVKEGNNTYVGYFVLNQQGDVIAILNSQGSVAVSYQYNAWGKVLTETAANNVTAEKLKAHNALKYRGYYYDAETGFYYVSSRYYDPEVGRFISADTTDVLTASPSALTDKNLYAYCDNNPVMRKDAGGAFWETAIDVVSLCVSVAEVMANPADPWAWAGLAGDAIDLVPFVTGVGELTKVAKVTVKAVDNSDDVIKATRNLARSSGIKKFTGSYEIMFESGTNYVGKGGLYRSTVSAKFRSVVNNDRVTSISWTPSSSTRNAYISEYNMMKKNGVKNSNTYNRIWSPGRSILQSIWTNLFGR